MSGIADRNVQLVSRNEALLRILKLTPELVADSRDLDSAGRESRVFNRMNYPRGGQEQHHHDEHGNDRPG